VATKDLLEKLKAPPTRVEPVKVLPPSVGRPASARTGKRDWSSVERGGREHSDLLDRWKKETGRGLPAGLDGRLWPEQRAWLDANIPLEIWGVARA